MMLQAAVKSSKTALAARARTAGAGAFLRSPTSLLLFSQSKPLRLIHGDINAPNANPVAMQMINYALSHARSQRSGESYAQGILVLEQCLSNFLDEDQLARDSKGMILLAMSDLFYESGNSAEAVEPLNQITNLTQSSLAVRVAAVEAIVGLQLLLGQDDASSVLASEFLELLENKEAKSSAEDIQALTARVKAVKGLTELAKGSTGSAELFFRGFEDHKSCNGNAALSYGEFLHASGDFAMAKETYQKVIEGTIGNNDSLGSCNMTSEEVSLAATVALGQLDSHVGNFADAEETLTRALTKAEEYFGHQHPKVGMILTGIALMFRNKAKQEHSSSFLIQEGLYRKALELMEAPSLDLEGTSVERKDTVVLARGGYAELLRIQENRKSEGEKMKAWADTAWKNRRLSLAEALNISEPSGKVPILDTRTTRVL